VLTLSKEGKGDLRGGKESRHAIALGPEGRRAGRSWEQGKHQRIGKINQKEGVGPNLMKRKFNEVYETRLDMLSLENPLTGTLWGWGLLGYWEVEIQKGSGGRNWERDPGRGDTS